MGQDLWLETHLIASYPHARDSESISTAQYYWWLPSKRKLRRMKVLHSSSKKINFISITHAGWLNSQILSSGVHHLRSGCKGHGNGVTVRWKKYNGEWTTYTKNIAEALQPHYRSVFQSSLILMTRDVNRLPQSAMIQSYQSNTISRENPLPWGFCRKSPNITPPSQKKNNRAFGAN